jgi:hypothetical protein
MTCWTTHNDYSLPDLPQQEAEGILRRPLGMLQALLGVTRT